MQALAHYLANYIVREAKTNKSVEVIAYGLELVLNLLVQLMIILSIAYIFNILPTVVCVIIPAILFRVLVGGGHCSTFISCTFTSVILFTMLGYLAYIISFNLLWVFIIYLILFLLVITYAPLEPRGVRPKSSTIKIKIASCVFLFLVFLLCIKLYEHNHMITAFIFGLCWQVFSITPPGAWAIRKLDNLMNRKEVHIKNDE